MAITLGVTGATVASTVQHRVAFATMCYQAIAIATATVIKIVLEADSIGYYLRF